VICVRAITLLRYRVRLAILARLVAGPGDRLRHVTNIQGGVREHLMGAASGVTWMS